MQPQIVEAGERLTRRYVASGPHYLTMRMGQQHSREPNETMECWVASYSGLGASTTPEHWIDGLGAPRLMRKKERSGLVCVAIN